MTALTVETTAATTNPVLRAIADRRSVRGYAAQPLTHDQLDTLLAAAVQSPSAMNRQPWHFSVVQNPAILAKINDEISKAFNKDVGDVFYAAPCCIFISCEPDARWSRLDCGIAVENIAIAAQAIGLGSVILGMPEGAFTGSAGGELNTLLKFPPTYRFAVAIAVGVPTVGKEAHPILEGRIDYID
ncbi:MAG: nitroreductase [Oscillospiraceae bacterium]|jgi:nitroreductase|nr:nitroreductase [Oscillospiraceae bacterium]